jgi:hypothetical protein
MPARRERLTRVRGPASESFTLEFVLSRFREREAAHKNPRQIWEPIAFEVVE